MPPHDTELESIAARPSSRSLRRLLDSAWRGERTLVMGVLNVTPDSFSDGGRFLDLSVAADHAERMAAEGADIVDVGGESTRPATFASGKPLPEEEEMARVLPVITAIAARLPELPISIDTYKASVAANAIAAGAAMINDVSALRADPEMSALAARSGAPVCLMHMPGLPAALPAAPAYSDVVRDVCDFLARLCAEAEAAGIARASIVIDPGIGFGKSAQQNLELLRRLREISEVGYPVLVGVSRKSFIGAVLGGLPPGERLEGTAAAVAIAIANGASVVRVHDVGEMARVARVADAIVRAAP
jgi:dihydropteroate synthase